MSLSQIDAACAHVVPTWSDDDAVDDIDEATHHVPQGEYLLADVAANNNNNNSAATTNDNAAFPSSAQAAAAASSSSSSPMIDATPVRFHCHVVKPTIYSASPASLHRQAFAVRMFLADLRAACRVASRAVDELRLSIVHVSSDDDEADDDVDEENNGDNESRRKRSTHFHPDSWTAAMKLGGCVPPVTWLRTSTVIPALVQSVPPQMELPAHCFLDVSCAVDPRECEIVATEQSSSSSTTSVTAAPMIALLCFALIKVARTQLTQSLLRVFVRMCFESSSVVLARKKKLQDQQSPLLFLRPRLSASLVSELERIHHQNAASADEANSVITVSQDALFDAALDEVTALTSDVVQDPNRQDLVDFVSSALVSNFSRAQHRGLRSSSGVAGIGGISAASKSNLHRECYYSHQQHQQQVGACGVYFNISEARVALRAYSVPLEKELLAESTTNTVPIDLLDAYVAASLLKRCAQAKRGSLQEFEDSLFLVSEQQRQQQSDDAAATSYTVDMLVLSSVLGRAPASSFSSSALLLSSNAAMAAATPLHRTSSHSSASGAAGNDAVYEILLHSVMNLQTTSGNNNAQLLAERIRVEMLRGARDIPASLRLSCWAALIGCFSAGDGHDDGDDEDRSVLNAAFIPCSCDRQVLLDLPRCHPSDPFMRSPAGQLAMHRVVRMWLFLANSDQSKKSNVHYWQGVDSMAAAVLSAGRDEVLAARCLAKITELFVPCFASGNAIRARVGRLASLVRFHDPFAASHLDEACGVQMDHFALPWILTAFAHVLPLSMTCKLWDALLLHDDPLTLLLNFTVAVISTARLEFLNAPDLSSSLIVLRHAPQRVVKNSEETGGASFANLLALSKRMTLVSPPYLKCYDDLENENSWEEPVLGVGDDEDDDDETAFRDDDQDDDDVLLNATAARRNSAKQHGHSHEAPLKRFVPSVRLRDVSISELDGSLPARWRHVVVAVVSTTDPNEQKQDQLMQKTCFVVGPRVEFTLSRDASLVAESVDAVRKVIRTCLRSELEEQQQRSSSSSQKPSSPTTMFSPGRGFSASTGLAATSEKSFVVVVVAVEKKLALEAAVQLAVDGIEHVATLDDL